MEAAEAYIRVVRRWLDQGNLERLGMFVACGRSEALVEAGIDPRRAAALVDEAAAALSASAWAA